MIRVSERQGRLLLAGIQGPAPRMRKPRAELPENQLEAQIRMYLGAKGWTVLRRHVGTFVPYYAAARGLSHANVVRIGERGESDWLCLRASALSGLTQTFTLETKAPGAKPSREQELWMARQRVGGFVAVWFNSFDRFEEWYQETWK